MMLSSPTIGYCCAPQGSESGYAQMAQLENITLSEGAPPRRHVGSLPSAIQLSIAKKKKTYNNLLALASPILLKFFVTNRQIDLFWPVSRIYSKDVLFYPRLALPEHWVVRAPKLRHFPFFFGTDRSDYLFLRWTSGPDQQYRRHTAIMRRAIVG